MASYIRPQDFITLLGDTAAWPRAARAQQPAVPVVGYLHPNMSEARVDLVAAFRKRLSETATSRAAT